MKKMILIVGVIFLAGLAVAQHTHDEAGCDCPTCKAKAAGTFTLPGLAGLNKPEVACEHEHDEHEGHEHDQPASAAHEEHEDHAGCSPADETKACCPHEETEAKEEKAHDHAACGGHDDHAEEGGLNVSHEMSEKIGLKLSVAQSGAIARSVVFPAEILLNRDQSSAVSPRYSSVIRQVFVDVGDPVKKGDILASLENRNSMAVYTVSAPLNGVVVAKDASIGESASEERVLFEVADLSSVWADISIFPKYQHFIEKGMVVDFVAHDGHTAQGVIKYVSPIASHETRTFTARCVLKGAGEDFTPGVFVRAQIVTESADVPVRVERNAVQTVAGSTVVFVSDEHGFESRDVVVGMADEHFVEIKRGLVAGESYVSAGSFSLKAQMVTKGMDPHAGHGH